MAATSVKVSESSKDRLEEIQARIRLDAGEKVTQQEVLDQLIQGASVDEIVDRYRDEFDGLDEDERERALAKTSSWGVDTSEDDIDAIVYDE